MRFGPSEKNIEKNPMMKAQKSLAIACLVAIVLWLGAPAIAAAETPARPIEIASIFSFSGKRPTDLGVKAGHLSACPPSPNCVSSQSADDAHYTASLAYEGDPQEAFDRLKQIVADMDAVAIVTDEADYLYAEFSSRIFGFVDDVELYLDRENESVQVRSASRLGESDLGVNRKRVAEIRQLWRSALADS